MEHTLGINGQAMIKKAKAFRTSTTTRPNWDHVTRRVTTDAGTGEILEDLEIKDHK